MSSLIETYLQKWEPETLSVAELTSLLTLPANARHAQVKRALAKGLLIKLKRGCYLKSGYLSRKKPHPFSLAQILCWPSYVSLESALSYHGLIPEAVYTTTSVTVERAHDIRTPLGIFSYKKLPAKNFFIEIQRIQAGEEIFFIATPWKALCDYVYVYKKKWHNMAPLIESLRIEPENLPDLTSEEKNNLKAYYRSKRIDLFLDGVGNEFRYYPE